MEQHCCSADTERSYQRGVYALLFLLPPSSHVLGDVPSINQHILIRMPCFSHSFTHSAFERAISYRRLHSCTQHHMSICPFSCPLFLQHIDVSTTSQHYVVVTCCDSAVSSLLLSGDITAMNPYGYLPGELYGYLPVRGLRNPSIFVSESIFPLVVPLLVCV